LLAIVALVGVGLAAAVFLRGEPQRTDPVGLRVLDPGAPVSAAGTSSPGSTSVVVHLVGRVRRPGLVSLPAGARLAQAVEAAGGLTPGTAVAAVNLARRLVDGEQIAIGVTPPAASAARSGEGSTGAAPDGSTGSTDVVVDLNLATAEQLDALPRVGPATAAKIIDHRSRHGPFSSVDQLLDVPGIGEATLAHLRDRVRV
jgi:competence protein ComEA